MEKTSNRAINGKRLVSRIFLYLVVFIICIVILYPYFAMYCIKEPFRNILCKWNRIADSSFMVEFYRYLENSADGEIYDKFRVDCWRVHSDCIALWYSCGICVVSDEI